MSDIEAIKARHEADSEFKTVTVGWLDEWEERQVRVRELSAEEIHADRATLLSALSASEAAKVDLALHLDKITDMAAREVMRAQELQARAEAAEARVGELEAMMAELLKCAAFVKGAVDLDDYEIRAQQLVRLVENRMLRTLKGAQDDR